MTTTTPPDAWKSSVLEADYAERDRIIALIDQPSQEYDALDGRGDYPADLRREQLRAVLGPLHLKFAAIERRIHREEAIERVANLLIPQYEMKRRALATVVTTLAAQSVDIAPDAVRSLSAEGRALEELRYVLHAVTNDVRFARAWHPIDELKAAWASQQQARDRVFSHALAPAH